MSSGEIEAVVMAAGEGRRMRPLSDRYPKAVLPIDGRPVIAALLAELARSGIERAWIVVPAADSPIAQLCGNGSGFGLDLRYAVQPEATGSAGALRAALESGARAPCMVCAADTLFSPGDVARLVEVLAGGAVGAMTTRRHPTPEPGRSAVAVKDGVVTRVLDEDPSNPLSGGPLWGVGSALMRFLDGLPGPPFALAEMFQRAIDAGERVSALEIGPTRDVTFPVDVLRENFPYLRSL